MNQPMTYHRPKLSIVLPTYNEAENILELVVRLYQTLSKCDCSFELIVVDDNSPDNTWKRAEDLSIHYPAVKVFRRMQDHGLVKSINFGLAQAQGDYVAWMDGDLSHPPELFATFIKKIFNENYQAAIASRYVSGGHDSRHSEVFIQRILSYIICRIGALMMGLKTLDVTSGHIMVEKNILANVLPLRGYYGDYFIQMIADLENINCKICEVPYVLTNRKRGESKTATSIWGLLLRGRWYVLAILKNLFFMRSRPGSLSRAKL